MTEIKISDEMLAAFFGGQDRWRREHGDLKTLAEARDWYRAGIEAALVASGWRREGDVLREAADRIDPGPRDPDVVVLADKWTQVAIAADRGTATKLRLWADERERRASEAEQYVSASTREQEDQKRSEEQVHG